MPLDLLDLPTGVIEQLAKVRLDAPIAGSLYYGRPKTYVFWILRRLGHRGLYAAAWDARHSVLKPTLDNVAILGDAEWCRVMLEGGADVEGEDRHGRCAIHWAAILGHKDTVAVLLEHGADINAVWYGWTALHHALDDGHADTAALLREHGAVE